MRGFNEQTEVPFLSCVAVAMFEFVRLILSVCLNIHTLTLDLIDLPNGLQNEIGRLKKLKELDVWTGEASDLKEVTLTAYLMTWQRCSRPVVRFLGTAAMWKYSA